MNKENFHILVISGGVGGRYGADIPKQYTLTNQKKPIIFYSVKPFQIIKDKIKSMTIVCDPKWKNFVSQINFGLNCPLHFAKPGKERSISVYNGLKEIYKKEKITSQDFVLFQEAVRPFTSSRMIKDLIAAPIEYDCVVPVINPLLVHGKFDAKKQVIEKLFSKEELVDAQNPKRYRLEKLLNFFEEDLKKNEENYNLDDLNLFLKNDVVLHTVKGEVTNIKITVPFHKYFVDIL